MGAVERVTDTPANRRLLLDLFTEIAIIEHLVRKRMRPHADGLEAQHFGVITTFIRSGEREAGLESLAWSFQVPVEQMRDTVSALAARGYVEIDAGECIRPTNDGLAWHAAVIDSEAEEFVTILSEFPLEQLDATTRSLMDIRRTFDNLPDR